MNRTYHKILTKEEEIELFKKYHDGDMKAFNELVTSNQLNVIAIARDVHNRNTAVPFDDLVSEGNIILMRSIELFNPAFGFRYLPIPSVQSIINYIDISQRIEIFVYLKGN